MTAHELRQQELYASLRNKLLLSLGLAAILYFAFLVWTGWQAFVTSLEQFQLYLLIPALLLPLTNFFIRFVKFDIYLRLLEIEVPRTRSMAIFFAGFAGTVTPGKLGEVLKSFLLQRDCDAPISRTAPIVLAERMTDVIALIILAMVGMKDIKGDWSPVIAGTVLVSVTCLIISWRSLCTAITRWLEARGGFIGTVGRKLAEAYDSSAVMLAPKQLPLPVFISVAAWFCECLAFAIIVWGFAIDVSLARLTFVYCFATLAGALAMLPGGLGATEALMVAFLIRFGAERGAASAATLLIRSCTLWFAVLVGGLTLALYQGKTKEGKT